MAVIKLVSQDQFTQLTTIEAGSRLVVLYFHTMWAEPCKNINEIFIALSEEPSNKCVLFISIDADEHSEISELFEVSAVPFFVLIRKGTILKEISGADPNEIVNTLNELNSSSQAKTSNLGLTHRTEDNNEIEEETEDQLNERLKKLTQAAPIMLFMKGTPSIPKCGFSRQMIGILREHQVKFGFFDILKDENVRQGMKKFSDWPTFPQLYMNGQFQGGLDIIKESLEENPDFFQNTLSLYSKPE